MGNSSNENTDPFVDHIYLLYLRRTVINRPRVFIDVLAGSTLNESEALFLSKKGFDSGRPIWYAPVPIYNPQRLNPKHQEILVYLSMLSLFEDWEKDFVWEDPNGVYAIIPNNHLGITRPRPEIEMTKDECGYIEDDDLYLVRFPCPWLGAYLFTPFPSTESPFDNTGPLTI